MALEESIRKKLDTLIPTTTKLYSSTGEIYEETRDREGKVCKKKLNHSSPGYVIDNSPDLSICQVLPWLYMGSQDVAQDYNLLKQNHITHILSIGIPSPPYEDITTTFMEAYDIEDFDIEQLFIPCIKLINKVRDSSGKIYCHCNAGISRSATIVTAYLIQHHHINHKEALALLKTARPKINPNPGFIQKLNNFTNNTLTN